MMSLPWAGITSLIDPTVQFLVHICTFTNVFKFKNNRMVFITVLETKNPGEFFVSRRSMAHHICPPQFFSWPKFQNKDTPLICLSIADLFHIMLFIFYNIVMLSIRSCNRLISICSILTGEI